MIHFLLSFALFFPPSDWEAALPQNPSPYVQVGFIGPSKSTFHPSINLATETTDLSEAEYVKAVKKLHLSKPKTQWRNLGKFSTQAGPATLTEITLPGPCGEIKMLQLIQVKENTAYILTGALLKEEYAEKRPQVLQSLQSLYFTQTLFDPIPSLEEKTEFATLLKSLSKSDEQGWKAYQEKVNFLSKTLGSHWQFLALKEGQKQRNELP